VNGRALLRPDEVLTLPDDYLIAFQRGMAPILAKRIKYYLDPAFVPCLGRRLMRLAGWGILVAAAGFRVWTWVCGN
jgi:type IV secretory pathway TraG/TraD family ATPase VirD4